MDKSITVKIYDFDKGLQQYDHIQLVRVQSKNYNLLIMPDFIPTIGELDGSLSIVGDHVKLDWENILGYYVIRHNTFEIILKDEYHH